MRANQVLRIGLMLWPMLMFPVEPENGAATAVKKILCEAGAPMPRSMTLPDRVMVGVPHLELVGATAMNENVIVSLRCRPRRECRETVGTLRYGSVEEATVGAGNLATSQAG